MKTLKTELEKHNKPIAEVSCKLNNAIEEYKQVFEEEDIYSEDISTEADRKINCLYSTIIESVILLHQYQKELISFIEGAKAVDSNLKFTFNPLCKHLDDIEEYTGDRFFNTAVMIEICGNGERDSYECYPSNSISEVAELVNT